MHEMQCHTAQFIAASEATSTCLLLSGPSLVPHLHPGLVVRVPLGGYVCTLLAHGTYV